MKKVTLGNMPQLPYAMEEALNRLRININFLGSDIKKIMVISTVPDEGKSFVTLQLWHQMVQSGVPSALLDMDLRKSVMAEKYEITDVSGDKLTGMSSYLAGNGDIGDALYHIEGHEESAILPNIENVVNPSLLIENSRFEAMLDTLAEKYRYVFLDAPPLDLVSDGEQIGSLCDGAILVVRGGMTSKRLVRNSINQLERAGCPLLGVVLNRVENSKGKYYRKYGKGYYGNYYGKSRDYYYGSNAK